MASQTKAERLALHYLETRPNPTKSSPSLIAQFEHRIQLVDFWAIKESDHVLEIGCGQGDTTVVLADAVGATGSVVAIDPGAADYGSPHTLATSQSHITSSSLGPRVSFHLSTDPLAHLSSLPFASSNAPAKTKTKTYTHVVLSHCLYYFASPSLLPALIRALTPHVSKICIAEWSLRASPPAAVPHVLAALLWASLEAKRGEESMGNIRTVFSPSQIHRIVRTASGMRLVKEKMAETNEGLFDGKWEVGSLLAGKERELGVLRGNGVDEREIAVVEAGLDALAAAVEGVEGGVRGVRCMDYWVVVFAPI